MKIEHIAIWVSDLTKMKDFYQTFFDVHVKPLYVNETKRFKAHFLTFGNGKTRLELMHCPDIDISDGKRGFKLGMAHFAISVGGKERVHELTEKLRKKNYTIASEPRTTGDGYYESVVLDPEGNYVEISA